ncbi:MAG: DNA gyrase inhibitor YacG [Planctomycetaceae bacterium]
MIRRLTCPVCEIELPPEIGGDSPLFPFCSVRCRQVDLYRWMQGNYAIVEPLDPRETDPEAHPPDDRE